MKNTEIDIKFSSISLDFYLNYLEFLYKIKDSENQMILRLSFLENISEEEINNKPIFYLESLLDKWSFLNDSLDYYDDKSYEIEIDGEVYYMNTDFNTLNMTQWQNMDDILKQSDKDKNYLKNIDMLIAITCFLPSNYDYNKAKELAKKIRKKDVNSIYKSINFFLQKDKIQSTNSLIFLQKMEKDLIMNLETITTNLMKNSTHFGAGIMSYTKLRMRIYKLWITFWLKKFKKSLHY